METKVTLIELGASIRGSGHDSKPIGPVNPKGIDNTARKLGGQNRGVSKDLCTIRAATVEDTL